MERVTGVKAEESHWTSQSLDDLKAQQGVSPVFDLDQISALWPVDDDPDKLLDHIQREREARRKLNRENVA